jgi:hypothetical protein
MNFRRFSRNPRQNGSALLVTLVVSALVGVSLYAYLSLVHTQNLSIARSQAWNYSMAIAEAGIEEALTQIRKNWGHLERDGWTESGGCFVKQRTLDEGYYQVMVSNVSPPVVYSRGYVKAPKSTSYLNPRLVRVTTSSSGMWRKGMVAKGSIDLKGNNIRSDSFDSADPSRSTGGKYDPAKKGDRGDVATNSSLTNSFSIGNADIWGHVATGPGGAVSIGPGGSVGSLGWHGGGSGGIETGWFTDDMNVSFDDVTLPFSGTPPTPASGIVGTTNYAYVLGNGNYQLSSLSMSGNASKPNKSGISDAPAVMVNGDAVLYVAGDVSLTGGAYIYVNSTARLKMYVGGASASLGGNGVMNAAGNATNFFYYGLPSNTGLSFSGNAAFSGAIYAPNADFTLGGGGSDTYDFVGASVTSTVKMNGHFNFHYDENLGRLTPGGVFVVTSWAEL